MKSLPFSSILSVFLSSILVVSPLYAQTPTVSEVGNANPAPDGLQIRLLDAERLQAGSYTGATQQLSVEVTDLSGAAVSNAAVTCRLPDSGVTGAFVDGTHAAVAYTDAQGRANLESFRWNDSLGPVAIRLTATKGTAHTGILVDTAVVAAPASKLSDNANSLPNVSAMPNASSLPNVSSLPRETTVVSVPPAQDNQAAAVAPVVAEPTASVAKPSSNRPKPPGRTSQATPDANVRADKLNPAIADPTVSVTHTSAAGAPHSSHAKWYVLAVVAVAAGAGAAFAMKGKSTTSTTPTATISIGTPTVSVGH